MTMRISHGAATTLVLVVLGTFAIDAAAAQAASSPPDSATLRLPLKVEKLAAPAGTELPSYETLELVARGKGRYDIRLAPGQEAPRLDSADLTLLVPRVPRLAHGNVALTRLALIQREFNRNEVHNLQPNGVDFSIANNCLERGLWEVKLARTDAGNTTTLFHAWFTFPKEEYARLFRDAGGLDYEKCDSLFASYPGVGGFPLPLEALRTVVSERTLAGLQLHSGEPLDRLPEQRNKTKLLKTPEIATYGDCARPDKQPLVMARFKPPGLYDSEDAMRFDLTWLARPSAVFWREVANPAVSGTFPEIEMRFENGYRILVADSKLPDLPARSEVPAVDRDVLRLVCGIGTPVIHANAAERAAEISEDRPRYLMILDAKGNHIDNHLTGVDGVYAWRDAEDLLHLWLVGYERIALVAHLSARWPARP